MAGKSKKKAEEPEEQVPEGQVPRVGDTWEAEDGTRVRVEAVDADAVTVEDKRSREVSELSLEYLWADWRFVG